MSGKEKVSTRTPAAGGGGRSEGLLGLKGKNYAKVKREIRFSRGESKKQVIVWGDESPGRGRGRIGGKVKKTILKCSEKKETFPAETFQSQQGKVELGTGKDTPLNSKEVLPREKGGIFRGGSSSLPRTQMYLRENGGRFPPREKDERRRWRFQGKRVALGGGKSPYRERGCSSRS